MHIGEYFCLHLKGEIFVLCFRFVDKVMQNNLKFNIDL